MSKESVPLKMQVVSRLEKWATLDKDRGDPETDPRCYEIIDVIDYPDGRREVKRIKTGEPPCR